MRRFFIVIMMLLAVVMVNAQGVYRSGVRDDISTKGKGNRSGRPRGRPTPGTPPRGKSKPNTPPRGKSTPDTSQSDSDFDFRVYDYSIDSFEISPDDNYILRDSDEVKIDTLGLRQQPSTKGKAAPNDTINGNMPGVQGSRTLREKDNH